jgi:hypothetical protein
MRRLRSLLRRRPPIRLPITTDAALLIMAPALDVKLEAIRTLLAWLEENDSFMRSSLPAAS